MKFYESGELEAILNNDDAIEHCLKCPYCNQTAGGSHICILGLGSWDLEEELAYEDDNQLECWKP